jgi:hypothetical protein
MTLKDLRKLNDKWLAQEIEFSEFENALQEYYGIETYNKCIEFFINFNSADLCDCLTF